jgi:site-specific DNA-cytosine methylase
MDSHVDNPFESPSILSTCTGMRGLEIGVEGVLGELRVAAYVEIEAFVAENLVQQMEQGVLAPAPVWTNLKTFPWEAFYGKLHWIIGGYPCQPFSHAGLRQGADDPRHLWPSYRRGIKKSRPMGVYFENVEGHLSLGLRDVLTDLRKLGYQVEVGLFSAAEVGAPHRRNRVFILGLENSFLLRMRGWSDEERAHWRRKIQTPRSGELGNARCLIGQSEAEGGMDLERDPLAEEGWVQSPDFFNAPDRTLGNAELEGSQGRNGIRKPAEPTKSGLLELSGLADADDLGKQQLEDIFGEIGERPDNGSEAVGDSAIEHAGARTRQNGQVESGGSGLADSTLIGVEGDRTEGVGITEIPTREAISGCHSGGNRWPARPGEEQYDWEAPRLESSVGYAIAGHNYREDLLRMAGNAVVPQQSEKAFRTLLLRFIK